jgi:predicted RNase H-like HicB family nuclease
MKSYSYTIHLQRAEEGGYVVTVPALPGCVTQGETFEEAVAMAREDIEGYLETLIDLGKPLPLEPDHNSIIETRVEVEIGAAL